MDSNKNLVQLMKSLLSPSKSTIFSNKNDKGVSLEKKQTSIYVSSTRTNYNTSKESLILETDEQTSHERRQPRLQNLPVECKLEIFSHLGAPDKVRCQSVCKEWNELIKDRCLWKKIDFSEVIRSFQDVNLDEEKSDELYDERKRMIDKRIALEKYYETEKSRMMGYFKYLKQLKPTPTEIHVCLDIGDMQDHWLDTLKNFLDDSDIRNLKRASINWKETPWKLFSDFFYTWSNSNYSDLIYKHRRRQRQFVNFFENFTAKAINLKYLNLPFDWSPISVTHLCQLKDTLEELVLTEYFVPQSFEQSILDTLLSSLTKLEKLTINIVFGSGLGWVGYNFESQSLKYLNLSNCKGIAISRVNMPRLQVLISNNSTFLSHYLTGSEDNLVRRRLNSTPQQAYQSSLSPSSPSLIPLQQRKLADSVPSLFSSLPESSFLSPPSSNPYEWSHSLKPLLINSNAATKSEEKVSQTTFSEVFSKTSSLPCLIGVLKNGAPSLNQLNQFHFKDAKWPAFIDSSLNKALFETCFCNFHSSRRVSKIINS